MSVKHRTKGEVILKSKNTVIRLHSIVMAFINKAFRFLKTCMQLPAGETGIGYETSEACTEPFD
ncbi:hypothetical protein [Flavivirga sp. 57AJ16]|uniref:hypothetical protein n=1 Tax=Flavivirga sp. 57AJ16 TaxID=3025307 RepID=UPI002365C648|nr:hypothetical protein [Flavivirga sp. 57AJ16]MDD7886137.1 hypothetical protein [Flavivirga sp. 57AJ16]